MGGINPTSKIIDRTPFKKALIVNGDANPMPKNTFESRALNSIEVNGGCFGLQVFLQKVLKWLPNKALSASSVLIPSAVTIYEKRTEFRSKDPERIVAAADHVGISIINGLTVAGIGTIATYALSVIFEFSPIGWGAILIGCGVATVSYFLIKTIEGWIGLEEIIDRNHGLNSSKKTAPERT